jgi:hypothetical protein
VRGAATSSSSTTTTVVRTRLIAAPRLDTAVGNLNEAGEVGGTAPGG